MNDLVAKSISQEILSPKDYLELLASDKDRVEKASIIPPKVGSKGFGTIQVFYKTPIYKV